MRKENKHFCVYVKTEEEKEEVLKLMEKDGLAWISSRKPTEITVKAPFIIIVNNKTLTWSGCLVEHKDALSADEYISRHIKPIIIYRNGSKVVALDKNTGNKGVAKCLSEDEFDFYVGSKLALERLAEENNSVRVGNSVIVTDVGKTYDTYDNWSNIGKYVGNFVKFKKPEADVTYKVVGIGEHDEHSERTLVLIQNPNTTQCFIVGVKGLKVVG